MEAEVFVITSVRRRVPWRDEKPLAAWPRMDIRIPTSTGIVLGGVVLLLIETGHYYYRYYYGTLVVQYCYRTAGW